MIASALLCGSIFTACDDDNDTPTFPEKTETTYDMSGFARGADVSWLSEMESSGYKFYTSDGKRTGMYVSASRPGYKCNSSTCMGEPGK